MKTPMKRTLIAIFLATAVVGTLCATMCAWAGESPIKGGGIIGLGLELGDPGTWGPVGKIWLDRHSALQPAVKLSGGTLLQLDYLWHDYDIVQPKKGLLPIYFGAGGDLSLQSIVAFGARGVVGISYIFDREDVPVDIYVQLVPEVWFFSGNTEFRLYGDIGSRYYF
jgi:hypothetical protein